MVPWNTALLYYGANKGMISIKPNQKKVKLHLFFSHQRRRKLSPDKAIILDQATKFSEFARVYILSDIRYPQHVSREIEVVSIRAWSAQTGNLSQAKTRPEREKKKKMAYNQYLPKN